MKLATPCDTSKVTSSHVRAALKFRYPPNSHALLFEVANGTGGDGRVFADAVALGLWPSHGHAIDGVEIKVSRSDFFCELKQPEKSGRVFRYVDRWWLACPKGMVEPNELPSTWGLLELHKDTLRVRVKAPKLDPEPMPRTFVASLLRRHAGVDEEMAALALRRALEKGSAEYQERLDRDAQNRFSTDMRRAKLASEAWQEVLDRTGVDFRQMHDADEFCRAVLLVQELGSSGWKPPLKAMRDCAERTLRAIDASGLIAPVPAPKVAQA